MIYALATILAASLLCAFAIAAALSLRAIFSAARMPSGPVRSFTMREAKEFAESAAAFAAIACAAAFAHSFIA